MSSTPSITPVAFPPAFVIGAGGRLGCMLRSFWKTPSVTWQSRQAIEGALQIDPLTEPERLTKAVQGHHAILCLAGVTPGGGDLSQNTDLALAAIAAAKSAGGMPVLLTSSAAVYGRGDDPWTETPLPKPLSDYGRAKLEMEHAALSESSEDTPVCALRIANVAGADSILANWHSGFELDQLADGRTPLRSYVGPRTLAEALTSLLAQASKLPKRLNVALPEPVEMGALLDAAGLAWRPRIPGPNMIERVVLDTALLSRYHRFGTVASGADAIVGEWSDWRAGRVGS